MNSMTLDTNLLLTPTDQITTAAPTQEAATQESGTVETIGTTDDNKADGDSINPFVVTVVGLAIVFLGLVVLIGIVKLIGTICRAAFGEKTKEKLPSAQPVKKEEIKKTTVSALTEAQRGELIAAISAAIAENMGKPVSGIRIRSIRKVG